MATLYCYILKDGVWHLLFTGNTLSDTSVTIITVWLKYSYALPNSLKFLQNSLPQQSRLRVSCTSQR